MRGNALLADDPEHLEWLARVARAWWIYEESKQRQVNRVMEYLLRGQSRAEAEAWARGFPNKGSASPSRKRTYSDATESASKIYRAVARNQAKKRK